MLKLLLIILSLVLLYKFYTKFKRRRISKAMEDYDKKYKYLNPLHKFRNAPCPCGSTKKIKKCHGVNEYVTASERIELMEMVRVGMNKIAEDVNQKLKQ